MTTSSSSAVLLCFRLDLSAKSDGFFVLTFVFARSSLSSMLASLGSPPSTLPSLGARLRRRGVALLVIGADQALLLGQERVDWKHGYCLPLIEMTQHVACDHQGEAGYSEP